MKQQEIEIDFSNINSLEEMHTLLQKVFVLPDFYGKNVNALIDCLSSLRYPADEMIGIVLEKEESLLVKTKALSSLNELCLNHFLVSIESANEREKNKGNTETIHLIVL